MKKMILIVFGIFSLFFSQKLSAQVLQKGDIFLDAYYGFPNLYSTAFRIDYIDTETGFNEKISGLGPIGVRGEYMLSDKVGLGLDIGFNSSRLTYSNTYSVYNNNIGDYETQTYDYDLSTRKIGFMATFNYHFIENEKLDFYAISGFGYAIRTFDYTSTEPNFNLILTSSDLPISARTGVGIRYFFLNNIAVNASVGFGQGSLVTAGVTYKFGLTE